MTDCKLGQSPAQQVVDNPEIGLPGRAENCNGPDT